MDAGNREGDGGDGEDAEGTWWWEKEKDAKVDGKHPELRYRSIRRPGSKPDVIPISHSGNFRFCIFCSFRLSCEETWKKKGDQGEGDEGSHRKTHPEIFPTKRPVFNGRTRPARAMPWRSSQYHVISDHPRQHPDPLRECKYIGYGPRTGKKERK